MKCIRTVDAVGHVLCHDITQIIKDEKKERAFKKGHVVSEEDIPLLLSLGKDHLYVWEKQEGMLHENEAAQILCSVCINANMHPTEVKEGKIELVADCDGVFQIDVDRLNQINALDEVMIASRHANCAVKKGEKLIGTRIIPLVIEQEKMNLVTETAGKEPLARLVPYKKQTAGIVTTGNEVFYGRIQDTFTPVIREKLEAYGISVSAHNICDDSRERIKEQILEMKNQGVDMIICTGGMSVDPDDQTPWAIRESGAEIVSYGAPVLPGAMFLLGYFSDRTPIMGLPGCVMYARATIFDLVLPRIAAGIAVNKNDLVRMGNGGLCQGCSVCHYPNCSFGSIG